MKQILYDMGILCVLFFMFGNFLLNRNIQKQLDDIWKIFGCSVLHALVVYFLKSCVVFLLVTVMMILCSIFQIIK